MPIVAGRLPATLALGFVLLLPPVVVVVLRRPAPNTPAVETSTATEEPARRGLVKVTLRWPAARTNTATAQHASRKHARVILR